MGPYYFESSRYMFHSDLCCSHGTEKYFYALVSELKSRTDEDERYISNVSILLSRPIIDNFYNQGIDDSETVKRVE